MSASRIDATPMPYGAWLRGADYAPENVACRLTPPPLPGALRGLVMYLIRVPNPRSAGPTAPDAFGVLRINYIGLEYFTAEEARALYPADKPVWMIRRAARSRLTRYVHRPPAAGGADGEDVFA